MIPRFRRSGRDSAVKPRVLLVDDHRVVLDRASAVLAHDFTIAGTVTDGREAIAAAQRIDPDIIVLDVNMPGLDGFQTCKALQQDGTRAPVVFLSMADDHELIEEAFRRGGRGYVLKSRMLHDLGSALDQVLLGRLFAPSLLSHFHQARRSAHGMHLFGGDESVLDGLAQFFDAALRHGDATCIIATEDVRNGLADRLRARGWKIGGPSGHQAYRSIDANKALSRFMRNGRPDTTVLSDTTLELEEYRRSTSDAETSRLTIFGTMAALLSAQGNVEGAIALEAAWSLLTENLPFFTICGYPAACFHESTPDLLSRASAPHWMVSHAVNL